ncbi:MAG: AraC family transcriptional regulator [Myxococcales bacterium]|nr:AraC family transcriptional regulator [Myxococcales bacterium]
MDVDGILRDIGVSASKLDDFDLRIPEASRSHAWIQADLQARDPYFGLNVAEQAKMGAYDVLDYAWCFSSTLGEALDQLVRFHRVLSDAWAISHEVVGRSARLRRIHRTPAPEVEAALAFLHLRARELTGRDLAPSEVSFAHAAQTDTTRHRAVFGCPVRFGRPFSQLTFSVTDLAIPIGTANPGVLAVLERYMSEILSRVPAAGSFVETVRAAVSRTLRAGAPPSLRTTSLALHASARTIQRRLAENGTTHQEIVDAGRQELAEHLLAEGRLSITEIAFLVGFSDVSGFQRMYKRSTGVNPSQRQRPD